MCGHFEPMSTPPRDKAHVRTPPREAPMRPTPDHDATAHERCTPVRQPH